jgi:predicted transcriptional regulator
MAALWAADAPLAPGDVQRAVGCDLAYTTVMTVLVRLHAKDLVQRVKQGKAFLYSPVQRADEYTAEQMSEVLANGADRAAVLARFVERLQPDEEAVLRQLLTEMSSRTED